MIKLSQIRFAHTDKIIMSTTGRKEVNATENVNQISRWKMKQLLFKSGLHVNFLETEDSCALAGRRIIS